MIILRSLNHCRREFLPTYVGLRALLGNSNLNDQEKRYRSLIEHKASFKKGLAYHSYLIYKGRSEDGALAYRACSAPSPISLLTESFALEAMALDDAYASGLPVYSYQWPEEKSGHLFRYYFDGYRDRFLSIAGQISDASSSHSVVSLDIKNFYPSVSKSKAMEALHAAMSESPADLNTKKVIDFAASEVLAVNVPGLPVGPPLCHVLGNLVLRELDQVLWRTYGSAYHRYVDDIAVVVPTSEVDKAISHLSDIIYSHGYRINDSKTDVIPPADWGLMLVEEGEALSFSELRQMLTELAVTSPDGMSSLQDQLSSRGFNLPISQYARVSNGVKWQGYFKGLLRIGKQKLSVSMAYGKVEYILDYALRLKKQCEETINSYADAQNSGSSRESIARLRRLVRLVQSMTYMYPPGELGFLLRYVPSRPETIHIRALLRACAERDLRYVLPFPGKTVAAFTQLWSEYESEKPLISLDGPFLPEEEDSLATLSLSGMVSSTKDIPVTWNSSDRVDLIQFCRGLAPSGRVRSDLSYLDELLSLSLGPNKSEHRDVLASRFDAGEDVIVESLYLGRAMSG